MYIYVLMNVVINYSKSKNYFLIGLKICINDLFIEIETKKINTSIITEYKKKNVFFYVYILR